MAYTKTYIARVEEAVHGSFGQKMRKAFLPLLITLMGCGTDQKDKDSSETEKDSSSSDESPSDPSNKYAPDTTYVPVDPYSRSSTPVKKQTEAVKTLESVLQENGWGCEVHVTRDRQRLTITVAKLLNAEKASVYAIFTRDNAESPWEFLKTSRSSYSQTEHPDLIQLEKEVKQSVQYGVNYIKNHYDCFYKYGSEQI